MNLTVEDMMDVGIRELRDSLSRYLAEVAKGETITVTDHGKPVARIVPVNGMSRLDQLIAEGRVTPALNAVRQPLLPPIKTNGSVSEFIAEQRG
jgi:prevent-host-death family protein